MFEVKKFNSGEYDVKLTERINESYVTVNWNWFKEPDVMIPLMKIDAIRRQYGDKIKIQLEANYLPYSRQDRMFEVGQSLPLEIIYNVLKTMDIGISTMAFHSNNYCDTYLSLTNKKIPLHIIFLYHPLIACFPDKNAINHFDNCPPLTLTFAKTRINNSIQLQLMPSKWLTSFAGLKNKFIICDDICDGGRTFIECAKLLKAEFGNEIQIDLLIYHAFMTHGLDEIKKHIHSITIINPDSYEYVCDKFPNDKDYFRLGDFNV